MLKGKLALITGGTRGIGFAIADKLAGEGADIALFYAGNDEAAGEARRALAARGARCAAYRCDVSRGEQVASSLARVRAEMGLPDILVNNAGITRDKLAMRMTEEDFRHVIDVNLTGVFLVTRALLPDFIRRRSGRIVNITSVSGLMGNAGQANYAAAKAGLVGLTKTLARETASRGITVNAVAPGFVQTDMTAAMDAETLAKALEAVPMRRMARPGEIADAVSFLVGDGASYITGQILQVDGGLYM